MRRLYNRRRGWLLPTPILCALMIGGGASVPARAAPRVEFIVDFSASMNDSAGGERGQDLVRFAVREAVEVLPPETEVGVRVFGHRVDKGDTAGSCADSELLIPFQAGLTTAALGILDQLGSRGLTPLGRVLAESALDFTPGVEEKGIVLITDGADTCDGDPVGVVRELRRKGFRVALHIIGVRTTPAVHDELAAIAALGEGTFASVGDLGAMRRGVFRALKRSFTSLGSLDVEGRGDLDTANDGGNSIESATPIEALGKLTRNHVRGADDPADVYTLEIKKGEKYHGTVRFTDRLAGGKLAVLGRSGENRASVAVADNEWSFDLLDVVSDGEVFVRVTADRPSVYSMSITRLVGLP